MAIKIDPEFKSYLRALSLEERAGLEAGIKRDGCLDPLRVWKGILIDGHNRYEICTANNVPFDVETINLVGREAAINWIIDNQLDKRNLSPDEASYYRGKKYNREKLPQGTRTDLTSPQNEGKSVETAKRVAAELHVSKATVERDGAYATAVDKLVATTTPATRSALLKGDVKLTKAEVVQLAQSKPEVQKKILAAAPDKVKPLFDKHVKQVRTEEVREKRLEKIASISTGNEPLVTPQRFPVLLADPPWRYDHAASESRAIENQYPTMSLDELCALPVYGATTDDAILFLWTTSPKLDESMKVLKAWGFNYRTCAVWDKEVMGMGYYFRQQHELLLVATKGHFPAPAEAARPSSVIRVKRSEHSVKPDEVYAIIETMYPSLPKMEMFNRQQRRGWHVWGNQSK